MPLVDIQNLTRQQLKDQKAELIEEASKEPVPELAARYVQALTDAKARDESLAVHAALTKDAQDELGGWQQQVEQLKQAREADAKEAEETIAKLQRELADANEAIQTHAAEMKRAASQADQIRKAAAAEVARATRSEADAGKREQAANKAKADAQQELAHMAEYTKSERGRLERQKVLAQKLEEVAKLEASLQGGE